MTTITRSPAAQDLRPLPAEVPPAVPEPLTVAGCPVGAGHFALIAGPCTVESREQTLTAAQAVAAGGATMLRGGAFKPRTSPYAFQGLGREGLALLAEAKALDGSADRHRGH